MVANRLKPLLLSVASVLALLLAVGVPGTSLAQMATPHPGHEPTMMTGGRVISGRLEFRQYCAPCHGMDAKGDGPVASDLKNKPANLTILSKTHGGEFPRQYVLDTILGTKLIKGHGTREMPIWGNYFKTVTRPGQPPRTEEAVRRYVDPLVAYIESIQQK